MTLERRRREIRRHWAHLLTPADAVRNPLYAALCAHARHDDLLIDILLNTPDTQARPNLVLAAVHDLVLEDPSGELGVHYPTAAHFVACGSSIDAPPVDPLPFAPPLPEAAETITRWISHHRDEVVSRMEGRSTQTNEVGRTAVLSCGLAAAAGNRPTALIDLGCSAGLNLLFDHYRIDRTDGITLGDPSSSVVVTTESSGAPLPSTMPEIPWRLGVDLAPPDLDDDLAARWLLACQWPDDLARFERSRRAMGLWRASDARPSLMTASVVEGIDEVLDTVPDDLLVVIAHSWMVAYLNASEQQQLASWIRRAMQQREVAWLSFEHPRLVPGLEHPSSAATRIPGASTLVLETHDRGPRVLAQAHPHGTWIRWES